ncbi:hypothetical protein [Pseudomonas mucidolens]|uniref:hypothetical protein n=1 Tax=Pseudomonas mucidolens TaxID=46679 RepID=UPI0015614569|nr:hypothetical protein [Pseudomonas mucidolens]
MNVLSPSLPMYLTPSPEVTCCAESRVPFGFSGVIQVKVLPLPLTLIDQNGSLPLAMN